MTTLAIVAHVQRMTRDEYMTKLALPNQRKSRAWLWLVVVAGIAALYFLNR